jgi:small subunit ribosomal protein S17
MAEATVNARGLRKQRRGTVVSESGDKTRVVQVERRKQHPLYGKVVRLKKKYHVHDENNESSVGDTVRIVETRPMSRTKRWRLVEVLAKHSE